MFEGVRAKLAKRKLAAKLANRPEQILIGTREKKVLYLREPTIDEFDDLLEGMISDAVTAYSRKIEELDGIIERLQTRGISATDFRLFKPYLGSFCNFIAVLSDDEAITGEWIRANITPAQFAGCINKMLFLLDIEELYGNFSAALVRVNEAAKKAKQK
jgi:hypothetical protein